MQGVLNLFAQYHPGKAGGGGGRGGGGGGPDDSAAARQRYFAACLACVGREVRGLRSVAFPFRVGCGLAGGDWPAYRALLEAFARAHPGVDVVLRRRPEDRW